MKSLVASVCALFLLPVVVYGSDVLSIPNIDVVMKSKANSDPMHFPDEVLAQTSQFMQLMMNQEFGDRFESVSLSIISEGITAINGGSEFVDILGLKGTVYFKDNTAPSFYDLYLAIDSGFATSNKLFLEILSESPDAFLSAIETANVTVMAVDSQSTEETDSSGLDTLVVAAIAVGSAVFAALVLCILCICCLGEPEEENEALDVKKTASGGSGQGSGGTLSYPSADPELDNSSLSGTGMQGQETLDVRSITSQDSSKFTYNPRSDVTDCGFTFDREGSTNTTQHFDVESWKKGGVIPDDGGDGVEVPFGHDISAIGDAKELSHIVEVDSKSVASDGDGSLFIHATDLPSPQEKSLVTMGGMSLAGMSMAGMSEVGVGFDDDNSQAEPTSARKVPSVIRPSRVASGARVVNDDLNDLGKQVAAHRTTTRTRQISPYSAKVDDQDRYY